MRPRLWLMTWPVFAQALVLSTGVMLLFLVGEALGGRLVPTFSVILCVGAALWLAHCAASASTETVTEYLGQLPVPGSRLRTLIVDAGFVYLLVLVGAYLVLEYSGLGVWLVDRAFERIRANDFAASARKHPYWLDMIVLAPLVYWAAITVQLHTRRMPRHRAFYWVCLEAVVLVVLPLKRVSMLSSGMSGVERFIVAYGVLAVAVVATIVLHRHCRMILRGDARPAWRALFST